MLPSNDLNMCYMCMELAFPSARRLCLYVRCQEGGLELATNQVGS
jgi:hypothetical protein